MVAKTKAKRFSECVKVMLKEWGKLLGVATSYERAHFFGNVDKEVEDSKEVFRKISEKFTDVKEGKKHSV